MERNLTTGSIWKNIFYFSLPYLLSYFLQTLYGMADLFIIGQFDGAAGTTAVSIGSQVMHMITVIIVGLAMGTTVSIAQAVGAKDKKQASRCTGNTITLFLGVSVVLMVILLLLVKPIVLVMSTPSEAVSGTVAYLTICFIGIPFITAYNIISSIFRGLGDSKSPMYFIAVACAANIALDYLFMGALHLGPSGAALGTTLSQTLSVILALIAIRKRDTGIRLTRSDLSPQTAVMGQILKIGVPIALQDGFIQIAFIIITIIANRRGLEAAAAVGIVEKIISFLFLIPSSMLSTVSALGAQNIGAGKQKRAEQTMWCAALIAVVFGLIVAITIQFISVPVVGLFTTDAEVARLGGQYIRGYILQAFTGDDTVVLLGTQYIHSYIWDCIFAGVHFTFSGYFCACGRSEFSFLHNIIAILLVRIPGVYLTSIWFPDTLFPMGITTACGSLTSIILCLLVFRYLKKKPIRTAV